MNGWFTKYKGKLHPNWKGGKTITSDGYISVWNPTHPYRSKGNQVKEHRLVMEAKLGRYLFPTEIVHHINKNKQDNRLENLELHTKTSHKILHNIGNKFAIGNKNWLGKHHTKKWKKYMSKKLKGRTFSKETIEKMRLVAYKRSKKSS